uniref:NADH-ubiquinone oxidoreductase chain 3 n=1 Tax=Hygrobates longiporus TaxID=2740590 RepID=A0A6J4EF18_9ACAR|nr:NADH dehydrogenase subunit 3 [Hygrobates longiporus]BCG28125.1 NADH dehydrogenase subunit 3 [Hygrobates longiporus]
MQLFIYLFICICLIFILYFLSKLLEQSKKEEMNSCSNFECGFNSQSEKNIFISGQFFMIALLFIVFDLEISLLIPILGEEEGSLFFNLNTSILFLILILSTVFEWDSGLIEWSK